MFRKPPCEDKEPTKKEMEDEVIKDEEKEEKENKSKEDPIVDADKEGGRKHNPPKEKDESDDPRQA
jgi:hypothetical protein